MSVKRIILIGLLSLAIALPMMIITSCSAADSIDSYAPVEYLEAEEYYPAEDYAMDAEAPRSADPEIISVNGKAGEQISLRHVILTGSIELEIKDTRETIKEIREIVANSGGIVYSSSVYEVKEGQYGARMTLRVPQKNFDQVMSHLEVTGKASNVQTGMEDVTMQYIDLDSRLKNQKAQEERLIEILDMAETVEEVLEIERELYRVRGEIEYMTAQFTQLQDRIAFATINLTLREEAIPVEVISPGAFENFGSRIKETFIGSINFVLNAISFILIALAALLPVMVLLGLVALVIILIVRRATSKKKGALEQKSDKVESD